MGRPHLSEKEVRDIFFGKHSSSLGEVICDYFTIFPQKIERREDSLSELMYMGNIHERNHKILAPVLQNTALEASLPLINELTIAYFHRLLTEKLNDPELSAEDLTERMIQGCRYLIQR